MENPRKIPSPISSLIQRALDYDSSIIYCFFKISIRQAMKIEVQKSFHLGATETAHCLKIQDHIFPGLVITVIPVKICARQNQLGRQLRV